MLIEVVAGRGIQGAKGTMAQRGTGLLSLPVAQVEGEGDEATRMGLRFHMSAAGATGIAPVQALPTVAAQWLIWNPNGNTQTAFLDMIGALLNSGTAGAGGALLGAIVPPRFAPATVPTISAAGVTVNNASPASAKGSNLIVASAQTLVNAVVGSWFTLGVMNPAGTLLGQTQIESRDVRGKLCIPPGCGLALAVISPTGTTPLFAPYASWREYAADLE